MTIQVPEKINLSPNYGDLSIGIEEIDQYSRSLPLLAKIPIELEGLVIDRTILPITLESQIVGYRIRDQYYAGSDPDSLFKPRKPNTLYLIGPFRFHNHTYSQKSVDSSSNEHELATKEVDRGLTLRDSIELELNRNKSSEGGPLPINYCSVIDNIYGKKSYRESVILLNSSKVRIEENSIRIPLIGRIRKKQNKIIEPVLGNVVDYLGTLGYWPVTDDFRNESKGICLYERELDENVFTPDRLPLNVSEDYSPVERVVLLDRATPEGRQYENEVFKNKWSRLERYPFLI